MVDEKKPTRDRSTVISVRYKDKQAIYLAYMSFVEDGGLFVPTKKSFKLGDEVFLLAQFKDEVEPIRISGRVVWITPDSGVSNKPAGIGVQFVGDDAAKNAALIEGKLGASISSKRQTHTM